MSQWEWSVLVVEDDRETQFELVGAYAELCGFEYRPALDGRARFVSARDTPTAVILDLMLPDVDGFEVCRQMRNEPI